MSFAINAHHVTLSPGFAAVHALDGLNKARESFLALLLPRQFEKPIKDPGSVFFCLTIEYQFSYSLNPDAFRFEWLSSPKGRNFKPVDGEGAADERTNENELDSPSS